MDSSLQYLTAGHCNDYELGYWSTRAWGCLQHGWLEMDDERILTLQSALSKIFAVAKGSDSKEISAIVPDIRSAAQIACKGASPLFISVLWRAYAAILDNPDLTCGELVMLCCSFIADTCESPRDMEETLVSRLGEAFDNLDETSTDTYTEAALGTLTSYGADEHSVSMLGQALLQINDDLAINEFSVNHPVLKPHSPFRILDLMKNAAIESGRWDGLYYHIFTIWDTLISLPTSDFFDVGRDIALLTDRPAVPYLAEKFRFNLPENEDDDEDIDVDIYEREPWLVVTGKKETEVRNRVFRQAHRFIKHPVWGEDFVQQLHTEIQRLINNSREALSPDKDTTAELVTETEEQMIGTGSEIPHPVEQAMFLLYDVLKKGEQKPLADLIQNNYDTFLHCLGVSSEAADYSDIPLKVRPPLNQGSVSRAVTKVREYREKGGEMQIDAPCLEEWHRAAESAPEPRTEEPPEGSIDDVFKKVMGERKCDGDQHLTDSTQ